MNFVRKRIDGRNNNWTNIYKTNKCKECTLQDGCVKGRKSHPYREVRINPLIRKIRLRLKTKKGIEKYNKRFHKGEVAQTHIEYNLGYREFKCRDNVSCENEVNLFSIAYNLKKIQICIRKRKNIKDNDEIIIDFFIFEINCDTSCKGMGFPLVSLLNKNRIMMSCPSFDIIIYLMPQV